MSRLPLLIYFQINKFSSNAKPCNKRFSSNVASDIDSIQANQLTSIPSDIIRKPKVEHKGKIKGG